MVGIYRRAAHRIFLCRREEDQAGPAGRRRKKSFLRQAGSDYFLDMVKRDIFFLQLFFYKSEGFQFLFGGAPENRILRSGSKKLYKAFVGRIILVQASLTDRVPV